MQVQANLEQVIGKPIALALASSFDIPGWEGESVLIKSHSRFMVRHELMLKACRGRGEPIRLRETDDTLDAIYLLQEAVTGGVARHVIEKDDVIELVRVDVRPKQGLAALLFRRSNPDAPVPVFHHKKKNTLRSVTKDPDEAGAISAHLFLHLTERDGDTFFAYRVIMEEMPGLGRSYMHAVIADVLRDAKYEYTNDHGEQKETYTLPVFHGVPSEKLGEALQDGIITFIELVRPPNVSGLDTDGMIPKPEQMKLALKPQAMRKSLAIVKRVQGWLDSKNWRDLRVQVQTADKRSRMVPIAREEDAADVLFVRAEEVTTKKPLSQCTDAINEELADYATKTFIDDKNWS